MEKSEMKKVIVEKANSMENGAKAEFSFPLTAAFYAVTGWCYKNPFPATEKEFFEKSVYNVPMVDEDEEDVYTPLGDYDESITGYASGVFIEKTKNGEIEILVDTEGCSRPDCYTVEEFVNTYGE